MDKCQDVCHFQPHFQRMSNNLTLLFDNILENASVNFKESPTTSELLLARLGIPCRISFHSEYARQAEQLQHLSEIHSELLSGRILPTLEKINAINPTLLSNNSKLAFRLYKQHFVELLRSSPTNFPGNENKSKVPSQVALKFLRSEFDTLVKVEGCAEFKKSLVTLIWDHEACANELQHSKREELANTVRTALLEPLGIKEPKLVLSLRHLCLIHNMYHMISGEDMIVPEVSALLLPDRDEKAYLDTLPDEGIEEEMDQIDDSVVNILTQYTGATPEVARRTLARLNGNLNDAYIVELCKVRLARLQLNAFVKEYCEFRGILSPTEAKEIDKDEGPSENLEYQFNFSDANSRVEGQKARGFMALRRIQELINSNPPISSESMQSISSKILEELNSLGFLRPYQNLCESIVNTDKSASSIEKETPVSPQLYFALRRLQFLEFVRVNQWENAIDQVRTSMAPLTTHYPYLLQSLKDTILLLTYRNAERPPKNLAKIFLRGLELEDLYKNVHTIEEEIELTSFKAVIEYIWRKFNPWTLAGPIYAALGNYLGLPEPALIRIVSGLLEAHTKCFKLQQENDRFESILSIDVLKQSDAYTHSTLWEAQVDMKDDDMEKDNDTSGSGVVFPGEEIARLEEDARRLNLTEDDINALMEISAFSRYEAIGLLTSSGGSLDEALSLLYS